MNLHERLTMVFRKVFGNDTLLLTPDMTADDIEEWDSFSHVNLILAIEIEFGIEFDQNEAMNFENVGALETAIEQKHH